MGKVIDMKIPKEMLQADHATAVFWNGPVSRKEVQKVFDEYTAFNVQLKEQVMKLDFSISYLMERFEVTPQQMSEYMDKKLVEFNEKVKAEREAASKGQ